MDKHPLEIRFSYGDDVTYWSKGHHDFALFSEAVMAQDDVRKMSEPKHAWWRFVPAPEGDDHSSYMHPAKPHSRGAFPVTYCETP